MRRAFFVSKSRPPDPLNGPASQYDSMVSGINQRPV
jgi:hypothetical protein